MDKKQVSEFRDKIRESEGTEAPNVRRMAEATKKAKAAKRTKMREDVNQAAARITREITKQP